MFTGEIFSRAVCLGALAQIMSKTAVEVKYYRGGKESSNQSPNYSNLKPIGSEMTYQLRHLCNGTGLSGTHRMHVEFGIKFQL